MNKITITNEGGVRYKVLLDDIDVSKYIRGVNFYMQAQSIPVVYLELVAHTIEIPDGLLSLVKATMEEDGESQKDKTV